MKFGVEEEDMYYYDAMDQEFKQYNPLTYSPPDYIASGDKCIIRRSSLGPGYVAKMPFVAGAEECPQWLEHGRDLLRTEAQVYERLGTHPRIVKITSWDDQTCTLTMEYLQHGCLETYLLLHQQIDFPRRFQWACEAAEGLQYLHSHGVVHCDVHPRNFLLDEKLGLKIIDFGTASLDGLPTEGGPTGDKYQLNAPALTGSVSRDIFSLGSTIFKIMTSREPYAALDTHEAATLYDAGRFPDLHSVPCADVISHCWHVQYASVQDAFDALRLLAGDQSTHFVAAKL